MVLTYKMAHDSFKKKMPLAGNVPIFEPSFKPLRVAIKCFCCDFLLGSF